MLRAFSKERQSVIQGWSSVANTLAPSLGMLIGGYVADTYGWRVLFRAPVIPVALAFVTAVYVLPDDSQTIPADAKSRPPFDYQGMVVLAIATSSLLLGINRAGSSGGVHAARPLALFSVLLPLLFFVEGRALEPILPAQIFRNVEVSMALLWRFARNGM